jgi:signal transduction histidine kinase/ActR/RegA family two-component response regulator
MKRSYFVFLVVLIPCFFLLQYSPWWSLVIVAMAMLLTVYYFYMTRLQGAESRNTALQQEIAQLQVHLDSSILKEQKAYGEAEMAKKVKRQLLATVNHEIRTPMNGMLGMTSLLGETVLTREQRDYIDTIRFCGENLLGTVNGILVSDLLNFSKSDRDGEELEKKDFELRNCVNEVLAMFAGRISNDVPELSYRIEAQVPEQLNGDRKRLSQLLMNLVENAIRHTPNGEISLVVRTLPATKDNRTTLEFELQDTGCGIPANKLSQLFNGTIGEEAAGQAEGQPKGLGLVICKKLAEIMGGSIGVKSQPGVGSIFTFTAVFNPALKPKHSPLNPGSAENDKKVILSEVRKKGEKRPQELSETFSREFPLRILVAEDNEINQKLILKILSKLGYEAGLALNGKEVLEMVDLQSYDLILMDVQMPEMDGLEATRMLRLCLEKQPVIIAMTANALHGDQDNCIQAGMDDYICKPVELNELIRQLEKWGGAIKSNRPAAGEKQ